MDEGGEVGEVEKENNVEEDIGGVSRSEHMSKVAWLPDA